ncbi:glycoside hydrolase family 3 N-terminal domain-containing protein [Paenibacillus sp. GCM10023252]|uniref:glycoside hydrolase family 3 N-terminal domain-containing protein n=1 Tax=Paenibacillus sp. GCM10023252 TaxID=3252649 RepID=UPI0036162491
MSYIYQDAARQPEERTEDLLGRMTLGEKIKQLQCLFIHEMLEQEDPIGEDGLGGFAFERIIMPYTIKEEAEIINRLQRSCVEGTRLGIPALIHAEALHGLTLREGTSFPQAIGLGATWDPELMGEVSAAIAAESKVRGIRQVLSPTVDLARDVRWGRVEETYGEDPYLVSRMAVEFCKSFERTGIVTTPKHFVANSGDGGRDSHPVYYSERMLRKVYFKPYEACIREAGSQSIMASYNALDGQPSGLNHWLLTKVLREEWGFEGFVVTDYGLMIKALKQHAAAEDLMGIAVKSISAGMDREIPAMSDTSGFTKLMEAVQTGKVSEETIDTAVRRVLLAKFRIGLFEQPYALPDDIVEVTGSRRHREIARKAAEKSLVLLRNVNDVLPLGAGHKVKKLAVMGAIADKPKLGGYSSWGNEIISILQGLREGAPAGTEIHHVQAGVESLGEDELALSLIPVECLECVVDDRVEQGMTGRYIDSQTLSGQPVVIRNDGSVAFNWGSSQPAEHPKLEDGKPYSIEWRGHLVPPESGLYKLGVTANGGARLYLDGELLIDRWEDALSGTQIVACDLEQGKRYSLTVQYHSSGGDAHIRLGWNRGTNPEEGVQLLRQQLDGMDAVVIVAGITEGEGMDRANLNLPVSMERLIQNVAGLGLPVIVVVSAGSAVTMRNWVNAADAILYAWYPGLEGGHAIADVLFGEVNPGGRLPVTFPQDVAQAPLYYNAEPSGRRNGYVDMTENPQFPFGYGLSYTSFSYSEAKLSRDVIGPMDSVTVTVEVTNTGDRDGDEVVQLYVRDKVASYATPLKSLQDFKRITLRAGQSAEVVLELTPDKLAILGADMKPVVEPGEFLVMVGASCEDIRITAILRVE